ncbi:hypothetical protein A2Z00_01850 [Candidatus Gottesmanbacteria bacterium RBG_13_45_10]|uniref:Methionyl-tRNA formyltransferase n=1 Tax=Candidatus Gottesmanbacteria bacterium RBG_13_45_10 TaxID=1798370 RepID=A0A1F5ZHD3_9BACT|nr:MAG: hypothetical protein A2Z00_01850 [Candidatus Gottesmanbacteria bacterium RBG_13_45_10]
MNILFFGSTGDSLLVLEKLSFLPPSPFPLIISAVVTQPPKPVGRDQIITPTPVETWARQHNLPVLSFPNDPAHTSRYLQEQTVIDTLAPFQADLLITAGYGQKIPIQTIREATFGGLNVHPSLLPRWRGADPVAWAIIANDHQTGVTIVTLTENLDEGKIIAQKKIPITDTDTTDQLSAKLFTLGADLLAGLLSSSASKGLPFKGSPQDPKKATQARRLTRDDGFVPWEQLLKATNDGTGAVTIDRKFRALNPWPGLWTTIKVKRQKAKGKIIERRLKILSLSLIASHLSLNSVQLEGKKPVPFTQFQEAYISN